MKRDTEHTFSDRYAVFANVKDGRGKLRDGAKVLVRYSPGGDDERMMVVGKSIGGRSIEIWEATTNLRDPRIQTVPHEHPQYDDWGVRPLREQCQYVVDRIEEAQ